MYIPTRIRRLYQNLYTRMCLTLNLPDEVFVVTYNLLRGVHLFYPDCKGVPLPRGNDAFPPCFRFPPYFRKAFPTLSHNFTFSEKNSDFQSAKISDDLFLVLTTNLEFLPYF